MKAVEPVNVVHNSQEIASWQKRVFLFLEDAEWDNANIYCEKILDREPENVNAYLGKLMILCRARRVGDLRNSEIMFDKETIYARVMQYADNKLKAILTDSLKAIYERDRCRKIDQVYANARQLSGNGCSKSSLKQAIKIFESIPEWRDSKEQIEICQKKLKNKKRNGVIKTVIILIIIATLFVGFGACVVESMKFLNKVNEEEQKRIVAAQELREKQGKLQEAKNSYDLGYYASAYSQYKELGDFDTAAEGAAKARNAMINDTEVGETICFGSENQEWIVLLKEADKALIISMSITGSSHFGNQTKTVAWAESHIRSNLNGSYLNENFTDDEKSVILDTIFPSTYGDSEITDKIFLLSSDEVNVFFENDEQRMVSENIKTWWLRNTDMEGETFTSYYVSEDGAIKKEGEGEEINQLQSVLGIRPAMWISIEPVNN